MNKLSFFSYAISFLRRDAIVTIIYTLLFTVLFYFFIFSVFIQNIILVIPQKNPYGLLKISANLSFLLCIIVLIFASFIKILLKRNEIGIMMAVGGNRLACIFLVTLEALIGIIPGFLLSVGIISIYFPLELPIEMDGMQITISALKVLVISISAMAMIIIPGTWIATLVDPYQFIKRQK